MSIGTDTHKLSMFVGLATHASGKATTLNLYPRRLRRFGLSQTRTLPVDAYQVRRLFRFLCQYGMPPVVARERTLLLAARLTEEGQ